MVIHANKASLVQGAYTRQTCIVVGTQEFKADREKRHDDNVKREWSCNQNYPMRDGCVVTLYWFNILHIHKTS